MKGLAYCVGRLFQILGLLALPAAIWAGQLGHNEKQAILIFLASLFVFFIGYLLTRMSSKL